MTPDQTGKNKQPDIILASQSPRRRDLLGELLEKAGLNFSIVIRPTDEVSDPSMPPDELCLFNAREKALVVFREFPDCTVIGADTLVFIDGIPLGKPKDLAQAREMLTQLSGRTHQVCTGVSIQSPDGGDEFAEITKVTLRHLSPGTVEKYLNLVHVLDKAGAYAFQEHGDMIIDSIEGYATNVIGLPVEKLAERLSARGYAGME